MGLCVSAYPFVFWILREYLYFILLSQSNRKYEPLAIVWGYVMKMVSTVCLARFIFEHGMSIHIGIK